MFNPHIIRLEMCVIDFNWRQNTGIEWELKTMKKHKNYLKISIRNGLAMSDCPMNTRLKSEDKLVELLGISRRYLREAFNELSTEGYLLRRRSSGTFLVARPSLVPLKKIPEDLPLPLRQISPDLLLDYGKPLGTADVIKNKLVVTPLNIQFWGLSAGFSSSLHLFQAGMLQASLKLGVTLSFHSLELAVNTPLPRDKVQAQLMANPASAYIVPMGWRNIFLECLGDRNVPIVFTDQGNFPKMIDSAVYMDTANTIVRGLNVLSQQGLKKIAFVALDVDLPTRQNYFKKITACYRNFMKAHDFDYNCIVFIKLQLNDVVKETARIIDEFKPEAIFINDDYLLSGIELELTRRNLKPGRDIAVVTVSNLGVPLPEGHRWSTLQYDPKAFGERALVEAVLMTGRVISNPPNIFMQAKWIAGNTHIRDEKSGNDKDLVSKN